MMMMSGKHWINLHALPLCCRYPSRYILMSIADASYGVWQKLCDLYDMQNAASQVYWLKKLNDLWMKEGRSISNHLNEFNTISSQLATPNIIFNDSVKAMFLLVTLSKSWDTFHITISRPHMCRC